MSYQIVDLSCVLNSSVSHFPADPLFRKKWHRHFHKEGLYISKIELGAHTGTHVDAPMHFLGNKIGVSEIPLIDYCGEAIAIDAPKQEGENITPSDVLEADIRKDDIVLFHTGWEKKSGTADFFKGQWPGFSPELIDFLVEKEVKAIGGDIASADSPSGLLLGAPAHKKAARAGLPIFEALVNLKKIAGQRFLFIGFPLKIEDCEASPVRAVAVLHSCFKNYRNGT